MTVEELEQCVQAYGKELYSFCRQIMGNAQEGEELYQDTFMKALENVAHIDTQRNPKSYLLSIAIRLSKNKKRKWAWRQRIAPMDSLDGENGIVEEVSKCSQGETPEEALLRNEQCKLMRQCIAQLPKQQQTILYLYYTAQLSVAEVAACMRIPVGTVKSRLHKARKQLKEKLEVAGYDR